MIEFRDVSKVYDNGTVALKDVNLRIDRGEFVFIVGASGAGKSTFLKTIMREEVPTSGSIMINNYDLTKMGASEKEIKKRVPYVLTLVGLQDKANNMPNEISGGEQQRVALARALVNNANTIIADEPTGNVDPEMSYEIVELLDRINENGTTIIMVTHEHELVKQFDHRIVVIDNGEVVSDMANGGVLHYDSKTGYQPVPNVTEMKTITLHNVSFQNAPVTQVIEPQAPAAVEEPVEIEVPVETAPAAEEPTLSFAEATLKEIELDIEAKRGGDSNG